MADILESTEYLDLVSYRLLSCVPHHLPLSVRIQMLKALMPVLVYSIGVALSKDVFKCNTMSNMAFISVGVAIAAYGEANFNALGVVFQLSALIFEATRLVLIQASRLCTITTLLC